ncbi:MAG: hypothetical protein QXZ70_09225 [Candidatus Bathyarchaeia archaeon]
MERRSLEDFTSTLVSIFKVKKNVLGKVDLQKTIYLAKRLGAFVPFNFRWNILGPYSSELAHYANHLVIEGLLKYSSIYELNSQVAKKYSSKLHSRIEQKLQSFFKSAEEICTNKNYDRVLFIECVASLDFINENAGEQFKGKKEKIFALLEALKPEKKDTFKQMREDAWSLLIKGNLI